MSSKFISLHGHSADGSLLDGVSNIPELVKKAKEFDMSAVGLSDHGTMFGLIKFYQECRKQEIKPILAMEAYISDVSIYQEEGRKNSKRNHLVLIAQNNIGWKNLMSLSTESYMNGFYRKPRVDRDLLQKYNEGLIVSSACVSSEVSEAILAGDMKKASDTVDFYKTVFPHRYYLEVQSHVGLEHMDIPNNEGILRLAQKHNLPVICTQDYHYVEPEDEWAHNVLVAVQTNSCAYDPNRPMAQSSKEFWFKPYSEMEKLFGHIPEALSNTLEIADQCNVTLDFESKHLPRFHTPRGMSSSEYLRILATNGAKKRYGEISETVQNRLDYELKVISNMQFDDYFLIVWDICRFAREAGILSGLGRGSGASSIVTYCLAITIVDPLKYNLPFERFLNPDRVSMPDLDLDFQDDRRDEVSSYIYSKYGQEHVSQIITFGTMQARAAVRDVGRALGMSYPDVDRIAKLVPPPVMGISPKLADVRQSVDELRQLYNGSDEVKKLIDTAERLEGTTRHASKHAAGILVTDEKLTDLVPLYKVTKTGDITTQWEMHALEDMNLLKIDLLGLTVLTILQRALSYIEQNYGIKLTLADIPLEDENIYKLIASGNNFGVFQLSESGISAFLRQLKPTRFEDIAAANALYRPGPMQYIADFAARRNGEQEITYKHPALESVTADTYGIIVYQEQLMRLFIELAGYTMPEADNVRRIVGKKKREEMAMIHEDFINRAVNLGTQKKLAEEIWSDILPFSSYSFNRSHSIIYSMIAAFTAYLKHYYPLEFMCAILSAEKGDPDKIADAMTECRRLGIPVFPPDVNKSQLDFSFEENGIRFGMLPLKNIGEVPAQAIIDARGEDEFLSLEDYCERVKSANKKVLETLSQVGALDSFGIERGTLVGNIEHIAKFASKVRSTPSQARLFDIHTLPPIKIELDHCPPSSVKDRLDWERELAGTYFTPHPIIDMFPVFAQKEILIPSVIDESLSGESIYAGGLLRGVKAFLTKKGMPMAKFTLDDLSRQIEVVVFTRVYDSVKDKLLENTVVAVSGKVNTDDGRLQIFANDIVNPKTVTPKNPQFIKKELKKPKQIVSLGTKKLSGKIVIVDVEKQISPYVMEANLRKVISSISGTDSIKIQVGEKTRILPFTMHSTPQLLAKIKEIPGVKSVQEVAVHL